MTDSGPDALGARETRDILERHGLRPKTGLGQHFIVDPNTVRRVVTDSGVGPGWLVLEVGPGVGTLTRALAAVGATVVAIERDKTLAPILAETVGSLPNVEVMWADAMRVDWVEAIALGRARGDLADDAPVAMVANLPYQISVPLLLGLLETMPVISTYSVMVQAEVGERLVAGPNADAYGGVSVKVAALAVGRVTFRVSRRVFMPMPEVESVVVRLDRRLDPIEDREGLWKVIEGGFGQRRKTLRRALRGAGFEVEAVQAALDASQVDGSARAEQLDLDSFVRLAAALVPPTR